MNQTVAISLPLTEPDVDVAVSPEVRRIHQSAAYARLRLRRNRLSLILSTLMLGIYYGFILLIAFAPHSLGQRLGESQITLGIPLGLGVILSAIVLTAIYVFRANGEFDGLTRAAVRSTQS